MEGNEDMDMVAKLDRILGIKKELSSAIGSRGGSIDPSPSLLSAYPGAVMDLPTGGGYVGGDIGIPSRKVDISGDVWGNIEGSVYGIISGAISGAVYNLDGNGPAIGEYEYSDYIAVNGAIIGEVHGSNILGGNDCIAISSSSDQTIFGDVYGNVFGKVVGCVGSGSIAIQQGDSSTAICGDICGDVEGYIYGFISGSIIGDIAGHVQGKIQSLDPVKGVNSGAYPVQFTYNGETYCGYCWGEKIP